MLNEQQAGPNRIGGEGAPAVAGRDGPGKAIRGAAGWSAARRPPPKPISPSFRRSAPAFVSRLRDLVNANLPDGYVERMSWGMISWEVPLERYPDTYNGQPLVYAAPRRAEELHRPLPQLRLRLGRADRAAAGAWAAAGRKLDMGKSCLRFKRAEDVAEDVLAETIRSIPVDRFIAEYEAGRARRWTSSFRRRPE